MQQNLLNHQDDNINACK